MIVSTDGIVLKSTTIPSGRVMLSIFTLKYGKISVGADSSKIKRRTKSSLASSPFTYGKYEFFKGRTFNFNGVDIKNSFFSFGEDIDKYMIASYALELTDKVLPEEVPEPKLFATLRDFMKSLEKRRKEYDLLLIAYELKLLKTLGVSPAFDRCVSCGVSDIAYFSGEHGGTLCEKCAKQGSNIISGSNGKNQRGQADLILCRDFDIFNVVSFLIKQPFVRLEGLVLDKEIQETMKRILKSHIYENLAIRTLKSEAGI